jgi:hypothetical protein
MGLIREPKNVDLSVLDKPWPDEELKEFSAFIMLRKEQRIKRLTQTAITTSTLKKAITQKKADHLGKRSTTA